MAGTWVVTGGAGYIGGHVVAALRGEGMPVVVLDDLSTGRADRLPPDVLLVRGRVGDPRVLRSAW
jgi:UDP-glucose 4-epimerase